MKAKTILTMAIIAALPFTAMAENISGAMYNAPAHADNNHPAPTTNNYAPYGRIDIDTADQEHIATTAYVKGAYNSAIAAVNKVDTSLTAGLDEKHPRLHRYDEEDGISDTVVTWGDFSRSLPTETVGEVLMSESLDYSDIEGFITEDGLVPIQDDNLISSEAVLQLIVASGKELQRLASTNTNNIVNNKRVEIYTTWDDDDVAEVPLVTASGQ